MAKEMGLDRAPIEFQTFSFSHVLLVPLVYNIGSSVSVPGRPSWHPDPQCAEFRERFSKEQFLVPT